MSDEIKHRVTVLRGLYTTGLNQIADWNKYVPGMQKTEQYLGWIEGSLNCSPSEIKFVTDETLIDYLEKASAEAVIFGLIPTPAANLSSVVNTSGSVIPSVYTQYVGKIETNFHDNPHVTEWARATIVSGEELRERENRSDIVRMRLSQLNPDLGQLYTDAVNASLAAKAGTQKPIEAAAVLDRVIERFKGELIVRCRRGEKANYKRISENLSANSELTKTVVLDGQKTYDDLNLELMRIRKSMQTGSGERIIQILHQIEDHVIVITDALDPDKVGISFS